MSKGGGKGNGLTLEIIEGITEHANRVALKGVFSAFGDVLACWVPPIDRRGVDAASVRFATAESAECAKVACDAGQVFFQGLPLKVKWRAGGGPRVGNSDIGGTVGGNSPTRQAVKDGSKKDRRRSRSGRRRRSRSRDRRKQSRERALEAPPSGDFNPMDMPMMNAMPPDMMMGGMGMGMGMGGLGGMDNMMGAPGGPMGALQPPPAIPEPIIPRMPTAAEMEAEAKRRQEAREKRAAQLKRGPGVAALVQGALKNAQVASTAAKKEAEFLEEERLRKEREAHPLKKTKAELEAERRAKEEEEQRERERLEREALEREKEKARQRAIEAAKEEERLAEEAANRGARVRAGIEAAKKQQAARERGVVAGKVVVGPENLYGDMPDPNLEPQEDEAEKKRKEELRRAQKNFNLPPEDPTKVVFLDVDGVLRPARAGGFDIVAEGKEAVSPDTTDFFPSAMKALRHIMERTGAILVLSSEWRRSEALRDALDNVLEANRIRPSYAINAVNIAEVKMSDPVRSFADRRAKEISAWLKEHEDSIKGWVVLDDINLAIADEDKKSASKSIAPKLVQTWPLCGLTMGNAKTAVRILNGEMIHKVLVERPKAPGGINTGA